VATIRKRIGPEGARFEAIIRRNRGGIHRESQTFDTREEQRSGRRDARTSSSTRPLAPRTPKAGPSLASLIRWYINKFRSIGQWSRTRQTTLEYLERHEIGKVDAATLSAPILVDHVSRRRASGVAPSTAGNDLAWIGCVLRAAKDSGECPTIDPGVVDAARATCNKLRLISHSKRQEVRPTPEQLTRLADYFQHRDRRSEISMTDINVVRDSFGAAGGRDLQAAAQGQRFSTSDRPCSRCQTPHPKNRQSPAFQVHG
jgi:hypothetical protein